MWSRYEQSNDLAENPDDSEEPVADSYLNNLLAVIHRDSGQHQGKVGTEQACADAMEVVVQLREQLETDAVTVRCEGCDDQDALLTRIAQLESREVLALRAACRRFIPESVRYRIVTTDHLSTDLTTAMAVIVCTCFPDCDWPCKGNCGCGACYDRWADYLSSPASL